MQSLETFYQNDLLPDLVRLEDQRIIAKKKFWPMIAAVAAANLICLYVIGRMRLQLGLMLVPMAIGLLPMLAWYARYFKGYRDQFKRTVIAKIVTFVHPDLVYHEDGMVPKGDFMDSHLFAESPDSYSGDDLVRGVIGETAIQCSEIWVQRVEIVRDPSKPVGASRRTRRKYHPIFNGLFCTADFNKSFNGVTIVLPDRVQKRLGGLGQALQRLNVHHGELIKLEDPDFEKLFVVYGQDQVEARYLLSTSLMRRMTHFQKQTPRDMRFSFVNHKLYVAIAFDRELFEPGLMGSLLDLSQVQTYYEDMKLVTDIVEELNLNRRIWNRR